MKKITLDNGFINCELELGKRYTVSDNMYKDREGILINISKYYVCSDGEVEVLEEPNLTFREIEGWKEFTMFADDIDAVNYIYGLVVIVWI